MGTAPSTRETTLHYYNDPVIDVFSGDDAINLIGVLVQGTPEVVDDKLFLADRSGVFAHMMNVDGVFISIDSWGNSHIDFTENIRAVGQRGMPVVAGTFAGYQGQFVVSNKYMDAIVDYNHNEAGMCREKVGADTCLKGNALLALMLLKAKMKKAGVIADPGPKEKLFHPDLKREHLTIDKVVYGDRTTIDDSALLLSEADLSNLTLRKEIASYSVEIIRPGDYERKIDTVLDFSPIAAKMSGQIGTGTTRVMDGVVMMLTGADVNGIQPANIGDSHGHMREKIEFDRPDTPRKEDYIIHVNVKLQAGQARTREGIIAAHATADELTGRLRTALKNVSRTSLDAREYFVMHGRSKKPRVLYIKLVSGLGNMYDTLLFPKEPAGVTGAKSIMDYSNVHIPMTVNEYRDGALHALT